MKRFGFLDTYMLGKHLAEQLAASYHGKYFPVGIIRPTAVSALNGSPYPGYVGNYAATAGHAYAMALGYFNKYVALKWWNKSSLYYGRLILMYVNLQCVPGSLDSPFYLFSFVNAGRDD